MFSFFKFLPLLLKLKDARAAIEEEKGKPAPIYWSRKVVGSFLVVVAGFAAIQFGVTVDATILDQLSNNIELAITALVGLYGAVMAVVSLFKKKTTPAQSGHIEIGMVRLLLLVAIAVILGCLIVGCCGLRDPWCAAASLDSGGWAQDKACNQCHSGGWGG